MADRKHAIVLFIDSVVFDCVGKKNINRCINLPVCTFHDGCKQGIDQQIFNRKSISRKITHPQS